MGVMLVLDGPRQPRSRRRGHHTRSPEEQACLDAFAAFLRYDSAAAERCLSRLGPTVLAGKLRPAARALAEAVDLVMGSEARAKREVELDFTVSPACLLGHCRSNGAGCESALCEHDCHVAGRAPESSRVQPAGRPARAALRGSLA
jgi:hypothetical protein